MDLAIAIRIGSPNSLLSLVRGTFESIERNIGKCSYRFILSLDPKIQQEVKDYVYAKQKEYPERFEILHEKTVYWSEFINEAIERAQDCEYFIEAHDDIELLTPDFFPKVKKTLNSLKEPISWINFNDVGYLIGDWSPSTRPGFHKDFLYENAWGRGKLFQFHKLPDRWWRAPAPVHWVYWLQYKLTRVFRFLHPWKYPKPRMKEKYLGLLDTPQKPVKCHAPWNMFVMIKMSILKDIGPCESWQTYNALLVDEDWGLRALQKKYWNIWIPSIQYMHVRLPLEAGGNRSQEMVSLDAKRVHTAFKGKWRFSTIPTAEELEIIQSNYKDTYIPWSIGRNSYDWEYIK